MRHARHKFAAGFLGFLFVLVFVIILAEAPLVLAEAATATRLVSTGGLARAAMSLKAVGCVKFVSAFLAGKSLTASQGCAALLAGSGNVDGDLLCAWLRVSSVSLGFALGVFRASVPALDRFFGLDAFKRLKDFGQQTVAFVGDLGTTVEG